MYGKVFVSLMVFAAMLLTSQAFDSMDHVLAAAKKSMNLIESGNDQGRAIIASKQLVAIKGDIGKDIAQLDDNVKVMLAGFLKKSSEVKSYTEALRSMKQNPLLEGNTDLFIKREDEFIPSVDNFWKFKGNPSSMVVKTVNKWFTKLIGDEQVITEINLTEGEVGYLVKSVASILKSLKAECEFTEQNIVERDVISLPVVRFPSVADGNLVIYNIDVAAWVQCKTGSIITDTFDKLKPHSKEGGLTGSFLTAVFGPRLSVLGSISEATKERVIKNLVEKLSDPVEPSEPSQPIE